MSLSEQDMKYIREVAINAASEVSQKVIETMLKWHTEACPHGKAIIASKWGLVGWCIGSGCGGATFFAVLSKFLE